MTSAQIETALLKRYLNRNHAFRTGTLLDPTKPQLALVDDALGWVTSPDAWQHASTIVGQQNIRGADWLTNLDASQTTEDSEYLLAFGEGSGTRGTGASLVTYKGASKSAQYQTAADFRGVFNFLFGSWFIDFEQPESIMATTIATNGTALAVMPMLPGPALHLLALGAPIGDVLGPLTDPGVNFRYDFSYFYDADTEQVSLESNWHFAIQGDPTLRLKYVRPVSTSSNPVSATINLVTGQVTIDWDASPDATKPEFLGYEVYRANSLDGTFVKISGNTPIPNTDYTDSDLAGEYVYMVRAMMRETTPSGTYRNASTGVFASKVILDGAGSDDSIVLKRYADATEDSIRVHRSGVTNPLLKLDPHVPYALEFHGQGGNDTFEVQYGRTSDGKRLGAYKPTPGGGVRFVGGDGTDTILIRGTVDADDATFSGAGATMNDDLITAESADGVENKQFHGNGGGDRVIVASGHVTFTQTQNFEYLTLSDNTSAALAPSIQNNMYVVVTQTLNLPADTPAALDGATLDLNNNDLWITNPTSPVTGLDLAGVRARIASARGTGLWNGVGLTSAAAANADPKVRALGAMNNADFRTVYGAGAQFHGMPVAATSANQVLVKYTYYGDTDFNGVVNFDDYALIDLAFNSQGGSEEQMIAYVEGEELSEAELSLPGVQRLDEQVDDYGDGIIDALAELLDELQVT